MWPEVKKTSKKIYFEDSTCSKLRIISNIDLKNLSLLQAVKYQNKLRNKEVLKQISVGTDIEQVKRFKLDRKASLLGKFFTERELNYCFSKKWPALHLAGRYAGKEALIKAVNDLQGKNYRFSDIEIINDSQGIPRVFTRSKELKDILMKISLSHSKDYAIAFAIAIEKEKKLKMGKRNNAYT